MQYNLFLSLVALALAIPTQDEVPQLETVEETDPNLKVEQNLCHNSHPHHHQHEEKQCGECHGFPCICKGLFGRKGHHPHKVSHECQPQVHAPPHQSPNTVLSTFTSTETSTGHITSYHVNTSYETFTTVLTKEHLSTNTIVFHPEHTNTYTRTESYLIWPGYTVTHEAPGYVQTFAPCECPPAAHHDTCHHKKHNSGCLCSICKK